jgi:hypothetical protein
MAHSISSWLLIAVCLPALSDGCSSPDKITDEEYATCATLDGVAGEFSLLNISSYGNMQNLINHFDPTNFSDVVGVSYGPDGTKVLVCPSNNYVIHINAEMEKWSSRTKYSDDIALYAKYSRDGEVCIVAEKFSGAKLRLQPDEAKALLAKSGQFLPSQPVR